MQTLPDRRREYSHAMDLIILTRSTSFLIPQPRGPDRFLITRAKAAVSRRAFYQRLSVLHNGDHILSAAGSSQVPRLLMPLARPPRCHACNDAA